MHDLQAAFMRAASLIYTGDADLAEIIGLSMSVSLTAVLAACVIGMVLGGAVGVLRFRGRPAVIILLNALMGLPPVVVGLGVYLLLSRAGPLGVFGLLYTPTAMIIAQTILVTPIVAALTRQVVEDLYEEYDEQLRSLGVSGLGLVRTAVGCALQPDHGSACRVRPGGGGGWGGHDRWRQYRPPDPGHDDCHRT